MTWAVLIPLLAVGAACGDRAADSQTSGPGQQASPASGTSTSATGPSSSSPTAADPGSRQDDLESGKARHEIRSSGITATVDYETRKPSTPWTATGDKPLRVEVKVSRPGKKVYLNRVTLRFAVDDGTGVNPGPDPLVDTSSNIVPGFLVAPPYSYVQSFAVPDVDPSSVAMTIDVKLEFVSLVDGKAKDYTKQTVTDRLTTTLS